jgi:crossover junction endodeoxyribonuclease RusA
VTIRLPVPPSINHYYRTALVKGHAVTYIDRDGKAFRRYVIAAWRRVALTFEGPLAVIVKIVWKSRRHYDIDGIEKALYDALEHAGAYRNDRQIKYHVVEEIGVCAPGWIDVTIGHKPGLVQKNLFEREW